MASHLLLAPFRLSSVNPTNGVATVNANGTLNLLEATRRFCPDAAFIFTSTNKVYGDAPNELPLVELETRWEIEADHPYREYGIDENLRIDQCKHSLFGASKVAGDVLTQEYGLYFDLKTAIFRGGWRGFGSSAISGRPRWPGRKITEHWQHCGFCLHSAQRVFHRTIWKLVCAACVVHLQRSNEWSHTRRKSAALSGLLLG